jgi:hypothetical protein
MARARLTRAGALGLALLFAAAPAAAQDAAALAKVKELNTKAIDAYENLDPEEARKFLAQALEICAAEGLEKHPLKATTHVLLGVVFAGALKKREDAIKQFRRAIEINPASKISKRLSTPEVLAAFEEASKAAPPAAEPEPKPEPVKAEPKPEPKAEPAAKDDRPPATIKGIYHEPVTEAPPGQAISVKAAVESGLGFEKVVLAYRPEGATDFLARDMDKDAKGWYSARIPEPATNGAQVGYYIEARGAKGQAVASNGSSTEPHLVVLAAPPVAAAGGGGGSAEGGADVSVSGRAGGDGDEAGGESEAGAGGGGKLFIALGLGTGYGKAKGSPEVNPSDKNMKTITFDNWAPAQLLHLSPEFGYQVSPAFILSLQGRFQVVTGATEYKGAPNTDCEDTCFPATTAFLVLARGTWLLGEPGAFRPYFSLGAGYGNIRHLVNLGAKLYDCGPKYVPPPQKGIACVDTIEQRSIFIGPAAGFFYSLSDSLALTAGVNALLAPTNKGGGMGLNFDFNAGVAYRL